MTQEQRGASWGHRYLAASFRLCRDLVDLARVTDVAGFGLFMTELARCAPQVLRLRSLRPVDDRMARHGERTFRVMGTRLRLPGVLFGGAREMYARRVYFQVAGFDLSENDLVVDLGANVGLFTLLAAKKRARVVGVEAQSEFLPMARRHLEMNDCLERAVFDHGIVGGGTGFFSECENLLQASHFRAAPPARTLPDILRSRGFDHIDFLKIDIEGSEFDLLSGGPAWLDVVEKIAMEVHPQHGNPQSLVEALRNRGFEVTLRDNDQRTVPALPGEGGYLFARRKAALDDGSRS